jgi:hypothetical protein
MPRVSIVPREKMRKHESHDRLDATVISLPANKPSFSTRAGTAAGPAGRRRGALAPLATVSFLLALLLALVRLLGPLGRTAAG